MPRKHKELKSWLFPGGWNHNLHSRLMSGGLCCHSSCLTLFGDNVITSLAETNPRPISLSFSLLAVETLAIPVATPAFVADGATLQLCA